MVCVKQDAALSEKGLVHVHQSSLHALVRLFLYPVGFGFDVLETKQKLALVGGLLENRLIDLSYQAKHQYLRMDNCSLNLRNELSAKNRMMCVRAFRMDRYKSNVLLSRS